MKHAKDHTTHKTRRQGRVSHSTILLYYSTGILIQIIIKSKSCHTHISNLASHTRVSEQQRSTKKKKKKQQNQDYVSVDENGESIFSLKAFIKAHTFLAYIIETRKEGEAPE